MFRQAFQILILLFIPLFLMGEAKEDLSFELDQYNTVFKSLEFDPQNFSNLVQTLNESLDFKKKYEDNKNKITPELTLFLQNQQKLINYLDIMQAFDHCGMKSETGKNFLDRIRQASVFVNSTEVCGDDSTVERLSNHVNSAVREVMKENLRNAIAQQSLENGFLTYLDLQKRYKTPNISLNALILSYCGKKYCSKDETKKLQTVGDKYIKDNLPRKNIRESAVEAVNVLNDMVEHPEDYEGKRLQGTELLIYTDTVQEAIRRKQKILFADVNRATDEITEAISKQRLLIDRDKSDTNIDRSLKNLIKTNPAAVGQILMKNPGYTGAICKLTQELEDDIASAATRRKVFLWGGLVVGGALAVTGVFSWAGAGIITAVSAETLTTVAAVSSAASLSIGVAESTYLAKDALEKRDEVHRLHSGLRSGNNDSQTQKDYDAAVKEYISLKRDAVLTLGFSMLDLSAITSIARAGKLKEVNSVLKDLLQDSKLSLKIQAFSKRLAPGQLAKMVSYLANLPRAQALRLIEKMKSWNFAQFNKWLDERALSIDKLAQEVKDAEGLGSKAKLLLTTPRQASTNILSRFDEFVFNPYATITRSSRKARLPISLLGYSILAQPPIDKHIENNQQGLTQSLEERASEIFGAVQASQFYAAEDQSSYQKNIIRHNLDVIKWRLSSGNKMTLPRMEEFEKIGMITTSQKQKLNAIAKEIFIDATNEMNRMTDAEVIDFAKDMSPETKKQIEKLPQKEQVEKARKIAKIVLANRYQSYLMNRLAEEPAFSNLNARDLSLLSTALWPLTPIDSTNDVRLEYTLQHAEKISSTVDRNAVLITDSLLSNSDIDIPQAIAIVNAIEKKDPKWLEKQKQDSSFLPKDKKYIAQRPDIPGVDSLIQLSNSSSQSPSTYANELAFWKDVSKNPLYRDIYQLWSSNQLSDSEVMNIVQSRNQSLFVVDTLSAQVQKRDLKEDEIEFLFGDNYSSKKPNGYAPMENFLEAEAIARSYNEKSHWTAEQEKKCKGIAAKLWLAYLTQEKQEVLKGNFDTQKLNASAKENLNQAMNSCAN